MLFKQALRDLFRERDPRTIPALDFLRTLAIFLVVGAHTVELGFEGPAANAFYWGWTGVDLFFVLSGYLIGKQLWQELAASGNVQVARFLLKRGFRIWPLYFATIAAYLLADFASGSSTTPLLSDLSFVSNYFHSQVKGGWSLATEEQFYVLLPALLFALRKLPIKVLVALPILWLAVLPILRLQEMAAHPGQAPGNVIFTPFHTHSDGLAMGVVIAWAAVAWKRWWDSKRGSFYVAGVAITLGIAMRVFGHELLSYTALAFVYGALVFLGLRVPMFNKWTGWRGFHVVSRLSYGMYLNHIIIVESLLPILYRYVQPVRGSVLAFSLALGMLFAVSGVIATVTFCLIEQPYLLWRTRWLAAEPRGGGWKPARTVSKSA